MFPQRNQHTGSALSPESLILFWEECDISGVPRPEVTPPAQNGQKSPRRWEWGAVGVGDGGVGRPARLRSEAAKRGRFPAWSSIQISSSQRQTHWSHFWTSSPRPLIKLYSELSQSVPGPAFTLQVQAQRSALRPPPERGARPSGLQNRPRACGATPLPERARTGGAAATSHRIPPANPGVGT